MGDLYAQAYKKIQQEAFDEHTCLRQLIESHAADFHLYVSSLNPASAVFHFRDKYRNDLDESMEAVLQYVKEHYQRKVKV